LIGRRTVLAIRAARRVGELARLHDEHIAAVFLRPLDQPVDVVLILQIGQRHLHIGNPPRGIDQDAHQVASQQLALRGVLGIGRAALGIARTGAAPVHAAQQDRLGRIVQNASLRRNMQRTELGRLRMQRRCRQKRRPPSHCMVTHIGLTQTICPSDCKPRT